MLLLIDAFTSSSKSLEGRTKLAKLDFLLRYPSYLERALSIRAPGSVWPIDDREELAVENRMIRYRYGPWDPAYFAILGRLVGKGLVAAVPGKRGISFRTTDLGCGAASRLANTAPWAGTSTLAKILRKHFDLSGSKLKKFVYEYFPEVTAADWGKRL